MSSHRDIGALYDRWVTSWTPWGWYTRWYLRHQSAINLDDLLANMSDQGPHARLLDVGCACGVYLDAAYKAGHGRASIAGVDLSGEALAVAQTRLAKAVEPGATVRLVKSSATELPFDDCSFDAVISNGMIKYLDDIQLRSFLSEVWRVLAPGGWLAMGEFGRDAGVLAPGARWAMGCDPQRFRSCDEQVAYLDAAGFSETRAFQMRRLRRIPFLAEGSSGRKPQ